MEAANSGACAEASQFTIRVGIDLSFERTLRLADPKPTGRQILREAGFHRTSEYQLLLLTTDGRLEEIDIDETVDLRELGTERFVVFESDRLFFFVIDERRFPWGASWIPEGALRFLAGVGPNHVVWQERRDGQPDLRIEPGESARLEPDGIERFYTREAQCHEPSGDTKYSIDIEGKIFEWQSGTITTEQIAELGGWDPSVGVIQIDEETGEEVTLSLGQIITLKPGICFQKQVTWKRGHLLDDRLDEELEILRRKYPDAHREGMWFLIPAYELPSGWSPSSIPIAAFLRSGYPGIGPYGIYVPPIRFNGQPPDNYAENAQEKPPFDGNWAFLSWEAEAWIGKDSPNAGHNILTYIDGFAQRFRQGR